jgi:hypothetical protein
MPSFAAGTADSDEDHFMPAICSYMDTSSIAFTPHRQTPAVYYAPRLVQPAMTSPFIIGREFVSWFASTI